MNPLRDDVLITNQTALDTNASRKPLLAARHVRVWASWKADVTAGVVTIFHIPRDGQGKESLGTLGFSAGNSNSLRVEGPLNEIEARITTAVAGGATPGVTVGILVNG